MMSEESKAHVARAQVYDRNTLRLVVGSIVAILLLLALLGTVVVQDFSIQADNHALLLQLEARHTTTETILQHLALDEKTNGTNTAYFTSQVKILEAQDTVILAELKKLGG